MSPGWAPMALTAGSELFIWRSWYGLTRYFSRSCFCSSSVRISCLGTSLCWKMSNAGNVLGRSSMRFFLAPCLTVCVYRPSVTIMPLSTLVSFMAFWRRAMNATPTVASPGMHQTSAFSFSFGMSIM